MALAGLATAKNPTLKPARALAISTMLAERFRRMHNPTAMKIGPEQVIKLLNGAAAKFVLMGGGPPPGGLQEHGCG